ARGSHDNGQPVPCLDQRPVDESEDHAQHDDQDEVFELPPPRAIIGVAVLGLVLLCCTGHAVSPACCALGESSETDTWETTCGTSSPTLAQALTITVSTSARSPRRMVA